MGYNIFMCSYYLSITDVEMRRIQEIDTETILL